MFTCLSALHALAAERGEGLRPELARLLERARLAAEPSQRDNKEAIETSKTAPSRARAAA